ncbi:siderophore-interacting protein [Siphonobacter sp. SORGH_AS_0500]|uniref:siderophore-interacting protein n=1 Tax=Siphonobacter sp. SORGH_AS_0500 TaxID=1864824 RepID=UPI002859C1DE|nr:siderophore-interacting protein [Siphonobacter sp. SORGH_AS_0500]MDR6197607.1 NADPH-dependent ferric siderophore reductase [Siphonobacter sp. SORGH_AS_0500]
MANLLKKAADGLLSKMFDQATVLSVRSWEPSTLHEIVIHAPTIAMEKWDSIKRFKCKVAELEYRDYTPAEWNADTKECTMYIETGHNGAGSRWARSLQAGHQLFIGPAHAAPLPGKPGKILCLGDGSALGHFLSLQQLTNADQYPIQGCMLMHDAYDFKFLNKYPAFEFISRSSENAMGVMEEWFRATELSEFSSIYIAGNIPMVQSLRKKLKAIPQINAKIYSHGFWS